jgi:hypothetical protein
MMGAARNSETLVNFYQTTRRYNPEDSHLNIKTDFNETVYEGVSGLNWLRIESSGGLL